VESFLKTSIFEVIKTIIHEIKKKIRPAYQNLRNLRTTVYVAKKMGEGLGGSKILFG
jgi:hypothetical protein